jgi:DNA-binding beta-propeller fold protein YncE
MSHDHLSASSGSDSSGHVDLLPAELQVIDERVATDAILWERRLQATDRLDAYVRSLSRGLALAHGDERSGDVLGEDATQTRYHTSMALAPAISPTPTAANGGAGRGASRAAIVAVLLIALLTGAIYAQFTRRNGAPRQGINAPIGTVSATIAGLGTMAPDTQHSSLSGGAYGIAASDSAVWVHNGDSGLLLQVDPYTNTVVAQIRVGHGEGGVAIGEGAIWVANPYEGTVSRIDPQTNSLVATIALGLQAYRVATITTSPGAVWVTDIYNEALIRIDPRRNTVVARLTPDSFDQTAALGPVGVSFGAGSVWLCEQYSPALGLTRLDPQLNQAKAQIAVGSGPYGTLSCSGVTALDQAIWTLSFNSLWSSSVPVAQPNSVQVTHIDPSTNRVIAQLLVIGASPYHFAADGRAVWLLAPQVGLIRVDPQTNREVGRLALPGAAGVAVGAGAVWVADAQSGTLLRITPAPG